jgi:hypothetical protein
MSSERCSFWDLSSPWTFLRSDGNPAGEEEFRALFDAAWERHVPREARDALARAWQQMTPPCVFVHWQSREIFPRGPEPAFYCHDSRRFFFHAESFLGFPRPQWGTEAIAHELAHAYLFLTSHGAHARPWPEGAEERQRLADAREEEVSQRLASWGMRESYREDIRAWGQATAWGADATKSH